MGVFMMDKCPAHMGVYLMDNFPAEVAFKICQCPTPLGASSYMAYESVQGKCKQLRLILHRHLFRRHDFKVYLRKASVSPTLLTTSHIQLLFIMFYLQSAEQIGHWPGQLIAKCVPWQITSPVSLISQSDFQCPYIGGGSTAFSLQELEPHIIAGNTQKIHAYYKFKEYILQSALDGICLNEAIACTIPVHSILSKLPVLALREVAACHGIICHTKMKSIDIQNAIKNHVCGDCQHFVTVFEAINTQQRQLIVLKAAKKYQEKQGEAHKAAHLLSAKKHQEKQGEVYKKANLLSAKENQAKNKVWYKLTNLRAVKKYQERKKLSKFPPSPPSAELQYKIISDACKDMSPPMFTEAGCAICGRLTPLVHLLKLSRVKLDLSILVRASVTQRERTSEDDPIEDLKGPVIEKDLDKICKSCHKLLAKGKVPLLALANGKWVGKVPKQLSDLSYAEQLLVARIRHNRCIVRVSSGMHKMRANAITFANPTPKVYDVLPPPLAEMDEGLAFIYTGPCKPTKADFERTPLLVRKNKVRAALEWLKLNHSDYYDLEISHRNLDEYPEDVPPVVVDYHQSFTNKDPESTAVYDNEDEEGAETGSCPFVVHGLTGEEYSTMSVKALKAVALKHLTSNRKILAVGHNEQPESIYSNPQLFPQMMPWLFPYGLGGIGNDLQQGCLSDIAHKRHLLMYYDKRFQKDPYFPLIAFNHEQIKEGTTGGYLLAEKSKFEDISKRLMEVDMGVLDNLVKRMEDGERIAPETDEEKLCFQLIKDLDHVGGHVKGSVTSKKYMRNEIWSLISFLGAPSWFITFAPADNKHPISLYLADTQEKFQPELRGYDERYRLIAQNPVAGARFFHFMVEMFIKHVLGVGTDHPGIYGDTAAYYGTVEQQGRLTLHLHLLLWIMGALSPQEIRDRIMNPESDFQNKIVEYLESVHIGEFMTGSMSDVEAEVEAKCSNDTEYKDPTQTLPEAPPPLCDTCETPDEECPNCQCLENWWDQFKHTVDDLIFRSNVHDCTRNLSKSEKASKKDRPNCMNKYGICRARFPRQVYDQTEVEPKTGALNMKKGEAWINTLTPVLTYLLRCNTDVTSLLSGTAIKAIVAYVSDYVTKTGLKTYSIFDTIRSVFRRNSEMLGGSMQRKEKARHLITQIVNALTAKVEIGGPMASLYLLGNPDHYTSHKFIPVYWKNYVREVANAWKSPEDIYMYEAPEKLVIQKAKNEYVGFSSVHDYIYRPEIHSDKTLYEWVQMSKRIRRPSKKQSTVAAETEGEHDDVWGMSDPDLKEDQLSFISNDSESEEEYCDDGYIESDNELENEEHNTEAGMEFLRKHPLYKTHVVQFDPKKKYFVPNFVGGTLPRRDRGDREYYCMTMLSLFKPWRSGKDIKSEEYSWDETFIDHKFTEHQLKLMENFNLRYECNDARDDFSAQLKQGKHVDGAFPQWMSPDGMEEIDDYCCGDDFGDVEAHEDEDYGVNKYSTLGPKGMKLKAQMDAAECSVRDAGWLDDSPDGINEVHTQPLEPEISQPGKKWKAAVRDKRQEIVAERNKHIPSSKDQNGLRKHAKDLNANNVVIVDQSYLMQSFKARSKGVQRLLDQTVMTFNLNTEQERAFRIVANHVVSPGSEQLKMYLGGMGGTGKSQVIKALIQLFRERNESHRFVVLAPTGTAAALLGGSTYHSFLGIRASDSGIWHKELPIVQVTGRLEGVDYIFLDEVSMLGCLDMYRVSSQLAKARNIHDVAFGGVNMIFAGDFAQLPPVGAASLYSGSVGTQADSGLTPESQMAAIGKALWHQVTTVVILRENMRQRTQTPEDAALRTALVNMRYGACTPADIKFLRSRIAGRRAEQPNVAAKDFRNVAIICGVHTHKDIINQLGCQRFAQETGQKLTNFYSIDKWGKEEDPAYKKKKHGSSKDASKLKHKSNEIDFDDQLEIWKLCHSATGHFPGKLSLCLGMPVMIRNNEATELCITKGQEGFVVGWQSTKGPHGKRVLDTLFIELDNPPQPVQIPGLPLNVVPIIKSKKTVTCVFPSDLKEAIEREQVWVVQNFAMTAHASQGKSRLFNVVHLNSCLNHMAYYTALSRSASASGTIIIQGFDSKVITKGCSGYLRQEFRELELLDDITRLRYEGKLPAHFEGHLRNSLIRQFQNWKGVNYVPEKIDASIRWSSKSPFGLLPEITDSPWMLVSKSKGKSPLNPKLKKIASEYVPTPLNPKLKKISSEFVPAKGSQAVTWGKKHGLDENMEMSLSKKSKPVPPPANNDVDGPVGLQWDAEDYSCAYDSLFVILYDIWIQDPNLWSRWFRNIGNKYLVALSRGFRQYQMGELSLEDVRDSVRLKLHGKDPVAFPLGHAGASVGRLAIEMLTPDHIVASSQLVCTNCDYEGLEIDDNLGYVLCPSQSKSAASTSKLVNDLGHEAQESCPECMCDMVRDTVYENTPALLIIEYPGSNVKTSHKIKFDTDAGPVYLYLRGIVYHGGFHFTSRIISADGSIWYHDGRETGSVCHSDGSLSAITDQGLRKCRRRNLVLAVYAKV